MIQLYLLWLWGKSTNWQRVGWPTGDLPILPSNDPSPWQH